LKKNKYIPPEPVGWPLLPVPENGSLGYPSLEESIRQSIRIILLTRPGERLMRPRFGAGLETFLHEPNTLDTHRRIHDRISAGIRRWEPRVVADRIEVREDGERPDTVRIEIVYRIIRTGQRETMALNMTLGE
jgi:phage baseplate assembly protein W